MESKAKEVTTFLISKANIPRKVEDQFNHGYSKQFFLSIEILV